MDGSPLYFTLEPDSNSPEIPLRPGKEYLIGRSPACTILLSDGAVSREHARIVWGGTSFELKDLGSTNGTLINDREIKQCTLSSMDRITFGRIGFTFKIRRKTANGNVTLTPGDTELLERELDQIIEKTSHPDLKQQLNDFKEKFSKAKKGLMDLAYNDDLTGLYNRRYFDRMLDTEWRRARRYERPLTLILADIDHFKNFNDKYGHQKGDSVLRTVATILKENCRSSDMVCRYGGEEMAVILPEQQADQGYGTAEKLRRAVMQHAEEIEGVQITLSFGVASRDETMSSLEDLIKKSDAALYEAKKKGRNRTETG
ncbi:MAG: GGDEF domain-containing protein [Spirochaetales bacterium]|nr:GGDEF domain-containing protein [Spirochaetales bacterium]